MHTDRARGSHGGNAPRGVSRRRALTIGAAGLALAAWTDGAVLAPAKAATLPAFGKGKVVLDWQPWRVGWSNGWDGIFYDATAPFRAANPGVDVRVDVSTGPWSNDSGVAASIVAGSGPDVYSGFAPTNMIDAGYNLDLAPYLKQYNVDTSLFDAGQFGIYVKNGGVFALPAELSINAVPVNLTVVDALGLSEPGSDWTYQEAESLWRSVTQHGSKPRIGHSVWGPPSEYMWQGWGASMAAGYWSDRCALDSAQASAFGEWFFPLVTAGVITTAGVTQPSSFLSGQVVCPTWGSWMLPMAATALQAVKWRFYPYPQWPKGSSSRTGQDYYAVSVNTKHPAEAAAFAIWLTTSKAWQESLIRLQLVIPPQKVYWADWARLVEALAPPLRGKNVQAFTAPALDNRGFSTPPFAYYSSSAYGLIGNYLGAIAAQKVSPPLGLHQASSAVNAFESQMANAAHTANKTLAELKHASQSATAVTFTMPSKAGVGIPSSNPPKGYITSQAGTWTMIGDGADVWSASDNCTFAALPWTSSAGSFTCRVVSIANLDCPHLSQWAKIGLMARGDLSDDAPMVLICASGANGVFTDVRPTAGPTPNQQGPVSPPPQSGLIAAKYLTWPNTQKHANYLLKPVWLRLSRKAATWSAYSSLDGTHWTAAGTAMTADMAGCWVGIFCLSHNGSFNGKGRIRATFDTLSFAPSLDVQLGTPGTP